MCAPKGLWACGLAWKVRSQGEKKITWVRAFGKSIPSTWDGLLQPQILRTQPSFFRCGPNIFWYLVDILERTKCLLTTDSIKPLLFVCYWWWRKYTVFEIKKSLEKKNKTAVNIFVYFLLGLFSVLVHPYMLILYFIIISVSQIWVMQSLPKGNIFFQITKMFSLDFRNLLLEKQYCGKVKPYSLKLFSTANYH